MSGKALCLVLTILGSFGFALQPVAPLHAAPAVAGKAVHAPTLLEILRGGGLMGTPAAKSSGIKPPRTRQEAATAGSGLGGKGVGLSKSGQSSEVLVGRDVDPQLGLRVRMSEASRKTRPFVQVKTQRISSQKDRLACIFSFMPRGGEGRTGLQRACRKFADICVSVSCLPRCRVCMVLNSRESLGIELDDGQHILISIVFRRLHLHLRLPAIFKRLHVSFGRLVAMMQ